MRKTKLLLIASILVLAVAACEKRPSFNSSPTSVSTSSIDVSFSTFEAAALIAYHASRDGGRSSPEEILSLAGYSGGEETTVDRGFNLLYRAYERAMPDMVGQRKYGAFDAGEVLNVPASAAQAYAFLSSHGLYVQRPSEDVLSWDFAGSSPMSLGEVRLYLDRFHAYCGLSLKDDFHNTVNHDYLYGNPANENFARTDWWRDSEIASLTNLVDWTKGIVEALPDDSSEAVNVDRFLASYRAFDDRAAGRLCGLFSTLDAISSCTNMVSLLKKDAEIALSQGVDPLFTGAGTDYSFLSPAENYRSLSFLSAPVFAESSTAYLPESEKYQNEALSYATNFQALGFTSDLSTQYGNAYCALKREVILGAEEKAASGKNMSELTVPYLGVTYGSSAFCLADHLSATGYDMTVFSLSNPVALVRNGPWGESLFSLFDDSHLDGLKAYLLINETRLFSLCLPSEQATFFGGNGTLTEENCLNEGDYYRYVIPFIENDVLSTYAKSDDYQSNVALAQKLLSDIKAAFSLRIEHESWLSEAGKAAAKQKLAAMKSELFLRADDGTESDVTPVSYRADDLYANLSAGALRQKKIRSLAGKPLSFAAMTEMSNQKLVANAFYVPNMNGIDITPGYLACKKGFVGKDAEAFLAQLGWAMGHEITHGFDSNGINYDENGQYSASWWSAADHEAYHARTTAVVEFYDGYECLPACPTVGKTTLSENIADLGGVRLMLDLGASINGFSTAKFFLEGAKAFASTITSDDYSKTAVKTDVHSYGRARVNRCFSSFPEFLEAYDITDGDMMYAPVSTRPAIW